jgi:transmembrane sensor
LSMSDELDPQLLAKWVTGRLDPAGQRVLAEWLSADPARAAQLDELRALWRMAGDEAEARAAAPDPAEEARWAGVLHAIREGDGRPAEHRERAEHSPPLARTIEFPYPRQNRTWTWAAAAAIVLAIGGGAWIAANRSRPGLAEAPPPMREYRTARGERAEFRLVDGTRVMLNVASRVRVPADFGEADRTVYVDGGAYFDVVHDARHPFVVHAGDIVAKDLGTEFVIRAYPEDSHAHVIVRAGRVALRSAAARDSADQ